MIQCIFYTFDLVIRYCYRYRYRYRYRYPSSQYP